MRNHKFGPHHIDFSFLQQLPFLFFSPWRNKFAHRTQVRQKERPGGTEEPGPRAVWGVCWRPKTFFYFFYFWGLGARVGRHFPQALTQVVTALIARNFSLFFSYTFLTLNNVTYLAIVKFFFDFLAASIPPSTSSVFPFGRQAKLKQRESTSKLWTGSSLSIDQICHEFKEKEENDVISCPVLFPFVNHLASNKWNFTFIHLFELDAKYFVVSLHFRSIIGFKKWKAKIGKTIVKSSNP